MGRLTSHMQEGNAEIRHRNLPQLLLHGRESVLAWFRPLLNAHGVTEQQWRIVRAISDFGPLEPRELVAMCGISSPSLAGVLARMESIDLVKRKRMDHDQRRQRVSLTPTSRALVSSMAPKVEAIYAALEQRMGRDGLKSLAATLDDLVERLGPTTNDVAQE